MNTEDRIKKLLARPHVGKVTFFNKKEKHRWRNEEQIVFDATIWCQHGHAITSQSALSLDTALGRLETYLDSNPPEKYRGAHCGCR